MWLANGLPARMQMYREEDGKQEFIWSGLSLGETLPPPTPNMSDSPPK